MMSEFQGGGGPRNSDIFGHGEKGMSRKFGRPNFSIICLRKKGKNLRNSIYFVNFKPYFWTLCASLSVAYLLWIVYSLYNQFIMHAALRKELLKYVTKNSNQRNSSILFKFCSNSVPYKSQTVCQNCILTALLL